MSALKSAKALGCPVSLTVAAKALGVDVKTLHNNHEDNTALFEERIQAVTNGWALMQRYVRSVVGTGAVKPTPCSCESEAVKKLEEVRKVLADVMGDK